MLWMASAFCGKISNIIIYCFFFYLFFLDFFKLGTVTDPHSSVLCSVKCLCVDFFFFLNFNFIFFIFYGVLSVCHIMVVLSGVALYPGLHMPSNLLVSYTVHRPLGKK